MLHLNSVLGLRPWLASRCRYPAVVRRVRGDTETLVSLPLLTAMVGITSGAHSLALLGSQLGNGDPQFRAWLESKALNTAPRASLSL
jgi:hypothetical protein